MEARATVLSAHASVPETAILVLVHTSTNQANEFPPFQEPQMATQQPLGCTNKKKKKKVINKVKKMCLKF